MSDSVPFLLIRNSRHGIPLRAAYVKTGSHSSHDSNDRHYGKDRGKHEWLMGLPPFLKEELPSVRDNPTQGLRCVYVVGGGVELCKGLM